MDEIDAVFIIGLAALMAILVGLFCDMYCAMQHEDDYGLG